MEEAENVFLNSNSSKEVKKENNCRMVNYVINKIINLRKVFFVSHNDINLSDRILRESEIRVLPKNLTFIHMPSFVYKLRQ